LGLRIGGVLCGSKRIEFDTDINLLPTQEFKCTVFVIESNVAGANLSVDGKPIHDSTGPDARATHVLPIGASSNIELKKAGFRDYSATISATQQGIVLLEARLDRLEAAVRLPKAIGAAWSCSNRGSDLGTLGSANPVVNDTATPQQGLPGAFDQYSLEKFIGEGGIASIYSGVDVTNGEKVAVKILRGEWSSDPEIVPSPQRFMARIRKRRQNSRPDFLVAEEGNPTATPTSRWNCAGETLAQYWRRRKQLGPRDHLDSSWGRSPRPTSRSGDRASGPEPGESADSTRRPRLSSADSESPGGRSSWGLRITASSAPVTTARPLCNWQTRVYVSEQRSMLPPTLRAIFLFGRLARADATGTLRADR
jgi:hypothetical protein